VVFFGVVKLLILVEMLENDWVGIIVVVFVGLVKLLILVDVLENDWVGITELEILLALDVKVTCDCSELGG